MKECMGEKRGKEDARLRGEGRHGQVHGGKEQGTKEEWNADRERRREARRDGSQMCTVTPSSHLEPGLVLATVLSQLLLVVT